MVKTDKYGIKQWDKRFGGTGEDVMYPFTLALTNTGGYIVGGTSQSGISGDKTEANYALFNGYNFWVVKIDSAGTKIWDHVYGGTRDDYLMGGIVACSDGGFALGGYTYSGVGGNKTTALVGSEDYWLIKIDSGGSILWQKDFGGLAGQEMYACRQRSMVDLHLQDIPTQMLGVIKQKII